MIGEVVERENVLTPLDELSTTLFQLKVMVTSGMGFFTDAYDLWIISVALIFITQDFSLAPAEQGYLTSASLFGAFLGPLLFGRLGDLLGRRRVYGLEMLILSLGAIGSALSPTYAWLLAARSVMGFGIGGDYPTSATVMAEYSGRRNRGQLTAMVFAMQGFGILTGILVAYGLLYAHLSPDTIWRVMLGLGAVPALSVIYLRRRIKETPRYSLAAGNVQEAVGAVREASGKDVSAEAKLRNGAPVREITIRRYLRLYLPYLFGVSAAWFLLDASYYGTGIFLTTLAGYLGFYGSMAKVQVSALTFGLAAFPGYWAAVFLIEKEGRKAMQAAGFSAMAFVFLTLGLLGREMSGTAFMFVYALSFFFSNYGPNTTTFIYPTELFPTEFRSTAHGIASSSGKLGAAISTLFFPVLLVAWGPYQVMYLLAGLAAVGAMLTVGILPETKGRSLEETSMENELVLIRFSLFSLFSQLASCIEKGAGVLAASSKGTMNPKKAAEEVRFWEHQGDEAVRGIFVYLNRSHVSAMDQMDVALLAEKLDDVMDAIEGAVYRVSLYAVQPDQTMAEFADQVVKVAEALSQALSKVGELSEGRAEGLQALLEEVHDLENQGDDLLRSSLAELFKGSDAVVILKLKDLYEHYEAISDRAEDVADVLGDLAVKYGKARRRWVCLASGDGCQPHWEGRHLRASSALRLWPLFGHSGSMRFRRGTRSPCRHSALLSLARACSRSHRPWPPARPLPLPPGCPR